jgi:hypothetical protein
MGLLNTLSRSIETAVKLPFAVTWDVISLGNLGEGCSTSKVLREHEYQKQVDDLVELVKVVKDLKK